MVARGAESNDAVSAGMPADVAIPRLLESYGSTIYWLGMRLCGNEHEADDLVQETFLQAYRKWHTFEGRSDPRTWIYTIATRLCQRRFRRRAGEPSHMASLEELLPNPMAEAGYVPEESQLTAQVQREAREHVEQAIATLPLTFRLPLVLKEIVGLPIADVAAALGIKEATVKTRVHRGRLRLRQAIEQGLPHRDMPPPQYSMQVCLDLLHAKQDALDRGAPFPVKDEVVCERCQALFATLDLTHDICEQIAAGELPDTAREAILAQIGGS